MSASIDNAHCLLRRLHSLVGLLPIGAFLVFHLWENSQGRLGADHYNGTVVANLQGMNYLALLEVFCIAVSLVFYVGYGLVMAVGAQPELRPKRYARNWLCWLQRVCGVGVRSAGSTTAWRRFVGPAPCWLTAAPGRPVRPCSAAGPSPLSWGLCPSSQWCATSGWTARASTPT